MNSPVAAALGPWWAALSAPLAQLWGSPVTAVELVACVLSVAMVVCNARLNPIGWPLAMVASALYALLFADSRLYGEAGLQLVFIAAAAWGWWQWLRGTDAAGARLQVRRLTPRQRGWAAAAVLAGWPLLGALLDTATDSDVPYWDALPTVGSLLGQWLLGRKWLETWPVWLAVNLVSVLLFSVKGLWLTAALYALFALMSVWGWRAWAREAGAPEAETATEVQPNSETETETSNEARARPAGARHP